MAKSQSESKSIIEKEGLVKEVLPNTTFTVMFDDGTETLAHLSGKMRMNYIRVLPGDKVLVELSLYNLAKGRIIRRN